MALITCDNSEIPSLEDITCDVNVFKPYEIFIPSNAIFQGDILMFGNVKLSFGGELSDSFKSDFINHIKKEGGITLKIK